jgi:hypothetical protein
LFWKHLYKKSRMDGRVEKWGRVWEERRECDNVCGRKSGEWRDEVGLCESVEKIEEDRWVVERVESRCRRERWERERIEFVILKNTLHIILLLFWQKRIIYWHHVTTVHQVWSPVQTQWFHIHTLSLSLVCVYVYVYVHLNSILLRAKYRFPNHVSFVDSNPWVSELCNSEQFYYNRRLDWSYFAANAYAVCAPSTRLSRRSVANSEQILCSIL